MSTISQNRLIKIFGAAVLVIAVVIAIKAMRPSKAQTPTVPSSVPAVVGKPADGDSTADTLRTVASELAQARDEIAQSRRAQEALREENVRLRGDVGAIEDRVTGKVTDALTGPRAKESGPLSGLWQLLEQRARAVGVHATPVVAGPAAAPGGDQEIPAGLGLEPNDATRIGAPREVADAGHPAGALQEEGGAQTATVSTPAKAALVWVEPLDHPRPVGAAESVKVAATDSQGIVDHGLQALRSEADAHRLDWPGPAPATASGQKPTGMPFFTLPENATLIDSVLMTPLIGRVPVDGKVTDPWPFKAIIGATNLAANGFRAPNDVAGIVVSGIAIGDLMLACTRGDVHSVTFVFNDGTIRTVSQRSQGATAASNGATGVVMTPKLGWLSDEHGSPCLNGKVISNAPAYLSQVSFFKALESAARAAALTQTTTTTNAVGGTTSAITGKTGEFVLGDATAGGLNEWSTWARKRMSDSFDAVYVESGLPVAIHLDQAIALDKETDARKLNYGRINGPGSQRRERAALD